MHANSQIVHTLEPRGIFARPQMQNQLLAVGWLVGPCWPAWKTWSCLRSSQSGQHVRTNIWWLEREAKWRSRNGRDDYHNWPTALSRQAGLKWCGRKMAKRLGISFGQRSSFKGTRSICPSISCLVDAQNEYFDPHVSRIFRTFATINRVAKKNISFSLIPSKTWSVCQPASNTKKYNWNTT
jgi:hypothetical protein